MKTRIIHTKFWSDSYVSTLSIIEQHLFLYLLTNDHINQCGVYELGDKKICSETNLTQKQLDESRDKLNEGGRLGMWKGWVKVYNVDKYNSYTGRKNEVAREKELALIPDFMKEADTSMDTSIDTSMYTPPHFPNTPRIPTRNQKSEINNQKSEISNQQSGINKVELEVITKDNSNYIITLLGTKLEYANGKPMEISDDVLDVWNYWEEYMAPITNTKYHGFYRNAFSDILKKHGAHAVRTMVRTAVAAQMEKFSTRDVRCNSPAELRDKWDALVLWGKRKGTDMMREKKKTSVIDIDAINAND